MKSKWAMIKICNLYAVYSLFTKGVVLGYSNIYGMDLPIGKFFLTGS